jgi:hypothetical protein
MGVLINLGSFLNSHPLQYAVLGPEALPGGASCESRIDTSNPIAFEVSSKRRKGFPSETHVKRGDRVVGVITQTQSWHFDAVRPTPLQGRGTPLYSVGATGRSFGESRRESMIGPKHLRFPSAHVAQPHR